MAVSKKTTKKSATKDKAKAIEPKIIEETTLLPENPLMASPVITVEDENEQKVELINEIESTTTLIKQQLAVKRQKFEIEIDNKKLDAANKVADNLENILDILSDPQVLQQVKDNTIKPLDYKMVAEAGVKQTEMLKNLMNQSVQDEFGGRKRTKIYAEFATQSGEKVSMGVSVDND